MSYQALCEDLRQRGLRLAANAGNITVRGPRSAMTGDVLDAIRRCKPELLAELAKPTTGAQALLDRLLDEGSTFRVIQDDIEVSLLWFGPARSVAPETWAEIARHKNEIIRLLQGGHPTSRRTWGEPTLLEWECHPALASD